MLLRSLISTLLPLQCILMTNFESGMCQLGEGGGRHTPNVYEYARNKVLSANHPNFQFLSGIFSIILSQSRVINAALLQFLSSIIVTLKWALVTVIAKLKGYFKDKFLGTRPPNPSILFHPNQAYFITRCDYQFHYDGIVSLHKPPLNTNHSELAATCLGF